MSDAAGTTARTLVLGATGFLGPHLVRAALAAAPRSDVVAAARKAPEQGASATFRALDLADLDGLRRGLDALAPRRILLAAAMSRGAACDADPRAAHRTNEEAPRVVAAWCAARGARLVHVSTDLVFGAEPPPAAGFDESAPVAPMSTYGRSKAAGEVGVLGADPTALVVRLPLLYGDSGGTGAGATDGLMAALERGDRPTLFTDEWRTPLEVGSAARGLVELLGSGASGLLHLAGPDRVSRAELGRRALAAVGYRGAPPDEGTRADLGLADARPGDTSLDSRRARALLGQAPVGLDAGLAAWCDARRGRAGLPRAADRRGHAR